MNSATAPTGDVPEISVGDTVAAQVVTTTN
jgi:hypothetical protein